ncbi:MAG TPA: hypothetical protein VHZ24_11510 [Pirellulales bacterium]|jgi:plastocyanin|nr:hypothetical protein [Pirellulales bacterium]
MARLIARLVCGLVVVCGALPAQAQWGNVKAKFVYGGSPPTPAKIDANKDQQVCATPPQLVDESLLVDPNGGIANVLLYVRTKGVKVHPDYEKTANDKIDFDNKHCRFDPHVLAVRVSQTILFKNTDPIGHNTNYQPIGDTPVNPLLPGGAEAPYKSNRSQITPQPVSCNIHPWMKGYILARDNPYMAISAPDGTLEIKNLPTGEIEFQAWQEKSGYLAVTTPSWPKGRFTHTVKPGDNDLGTIKVDPALFNK